MYMHTRCLYHAWKGLRDGVAIPRRVCVCVCVCRVVGVYGIYQGHHVGITSMQRHVLLFYGMVYQPVVLRGSIPLG